MSAKTSKIFSIDDILRRVERPYRPTFVQDVNKCEAPKCATLTGSPTLVSSPLPHDVNDDDNHTSSLDVEEEERSSDVTNNDSVSDFIDDVETRYNGKSTSFESERGSAASSDHCVDAGDDVKTRCYGKSKSFQSERGSATSSDHYVDTSRIGDAWSQSLRFSQSSRDLGERAGNSYGCHTATSLHPSRWVNKGKDQQHPNNEMCRQDDCKYQMGIFVFFKWVECIFHSFIHFSKINVRSKQN